jgi:hypothetical protein
MQNAMRMTDNGYAPFGSKVCANQRESPTTAKIPQFGAGIGSADAQRFNCQRTSKCG